MCKYIKSVFTRIFTEVIDSEYDMQGNCELLIFGLVKQI